MFDFSPPGIITGPLLPGGDPVSPPGWKLLRLAGSLVLGRIAARDGQSGLALAAASTCCTFEPHNGTTSLCVTLVNFKKEIHKNWEEKNLL